MAIIAIDNQQLNVYLNTVNNLVNILDRESTLKVTDRQLSGDNIDKMNEVIGTILTDVNTMFAPET